jgi:hypothetical protein
MESLCQTIDGAGTPNQTAAAMVWPLLKQVVNWGTPFRRGTPLRFYPPPAGVHRRETVIPDKQLVSAVRHAFLRYLARGDVPSGVIEHIEVIERTEGNALVKIRWTFDGALPPAPDDALYTVSFEENRLLEIDGPEW